MKGEAWEMIEEGRRRRKRKIAGGKKKKRRGTKAATVCMLWRMMLGDRGRQMYCRGRVSRVCT